MMKRALIVFIFALSIISSNCFAFRYVGVGVGPSLALKGFSGTKYFFNAEWQPSGYVGTRLIIGFPDGIWIGAGPNFAYSTTDAFSESMTLTVNGGPFFVLNVRESVKVAFVGLNAGVSLSFDIDGRGLYYIYVSPAEFFLAPFVWRISPSGGWSTDANISLTASVGFRASI